MDILLIAGLWLDGSAWDAVVPELKSLGHNPVPLTLPGQGDGSTSATLDEQVAEVVRAVDASDGSVVLVGHSAAGTLAWLAADARPHKVAKVALIGGWPSADSEAYADFFETKDGFMPFPGWEPFEGADSADLSEEDKQKFTSMALPVPEAVAKGAVHFSDEKRFDVPVVLVCPEFSPAEVRELVESGELRELAKAKHLSYVDIDSGHWPMFTRPRELARLLGDLAGRT